MTTTLRADRAQVLAYRAAVQGLHRDATCADDLAVLDIGLQHAAGESVRLALDARLPDTPPPGGFGPGEALALEWSLRGAPNVHRRGELNALAGALWPLSEADAVSRLDASGSLRKAGMSAVQAFELTVDALRAVVTAPRTKGAASAAVTARLPPALIKDCRGCGSRHVFELPFRMGALPAGLELAPDAPPVLAPRPRPNHPHRADRAALRRLITAYLRVLGPAGPVEAAGYLDARRADVAEVWPGDLVEVEVDGKASWLPADALDSFTAAPEPALVRLLSGFDPWVQARDRLLIVPDKAVHKRMWPVLGRPGVIFAEGEIVGTWRAKSAAKTLSVTLEPFAELAAPTWAAVQAEAERVAAVRGASSVRVLR